MNNRAMDLTKRGQTADGAAFRRRLIIRTILVAVWVGLGVLLFVMNRGHTILVDNRSLVSPETRAPDLINVSLDGIDAVEFFRGDRDIFKVGGGRHRIKVEFSDGTPPFETRFSLPLGPDIFILSIPKMINGVEPFFEVFNEEPAQRGNTASAEEESGQDASPSPAIP